MTSTSAGTARLLAANVSAFGIPLQRRPFLRFLWFCVLEVHLISIVSFTSDVHFS